VHAVYSINPRCTGTGSRRPDQHRGQDRVPQSRTSTVFPVMAPLDTRLA